MIFSHAGAEATDIFTAFHPTSVWSQLEQFKIGRLEKTESESGKGKTFEQDLRSLRVQMQKYGYFETRYVLGFD